MKHKIAALALLALLAGCSTSAEDPNFGGVPITLIDETAAEEPDITEMNASQAAAGAGPAIEIPADPDQGFTVTDHEGHRIPEAMLIDPPRHPTHPAHNRQLLIPSGPVRPELGRAAEMNALFLLAAGEGPHPTMILLHGLPGNERNLDLAQAVRRAGWNVLTFTYRGAWGSEGTFSIQHAVADTEAALGFVRRPETADRFGVDASRIVLAGHSMGGYMAAHVAAHDRRFRPTVVQACEPPPCELIPEIESVPPLAGVILLDAWDIGADAAKMQAGDEGRAAFLAGFDDIGHALGPITAADLYVSLMRRGTEWSLAALAPALARQRVLTVYATHGGAEPNRALARAIAAACPAGAGTPDCAGALRAVELNTDHSFADHRVALAAEVVRWLGRRELVR